MVYKRLEWYLIQGIAFFLDRGQKRAGVVGRKTKKKKQINQPSRQMYPII